MLQNDENKYYHQATRVYKIAFKYQELSIRRLSIILFKVFFKNIKT